MKFRLSLMGRLWSRPRSEEIKANEQKRAVIWKWQAERTKPLLPSTQQCSILYRILKAVLIKRHLFYFPLYVVDMAVGSGLSLLRVKRAMTTFFFFATHTCISLPKLCAASWLSYRASPMFQIRYLRSQRKRVGMFTLGNVCEGRYWAHPKVCLPQLCKELSTFTILTSLP